MSGQGIVVAVIVAVSAVYLAVALMPGSWRAALAARIGRLGRRTRLPGWVVARLAGGVAKTGGCSGCGGGSQVADLKKWARQNARKA